MAIGSGMQGVVAIVNLVCFYMIGIPLGALLGYLTTLEVKVHKYYVFSTNESYFISGFYMMISIIWQGIWIGMIFGILTQTIILGYMTWTTDWDDQVNVYEYESNYLYYFRFLYASWLMNENFVLSIVGQEGFWTASKILPAFKWKPWANF